MTSSNLEQIIISNGSLERLNSKNIDKQYEVAQEDYFYKFSTEKTYEAAILQLKNKLVEEKYDGLVDKSMINLNKYFILITGTAIKIKKNN
jgi:predicted glutamine amidotransferase